MFEENQLRLRRVTSVTGMAAGHREKICGSYGTTMRVVCRAPRPEGESAVILVVGGPPDDSVPGRRQTSSLGASDLVAFRVPTIG